ncbi:MAG: hypothetical protein J0M22_17025 [Gammaproteobacteria bacterium]|nr:hypothetical protein [Gammaproteobacteria bacterium]
MVRLVRFIQCSLATRDTGSEVSAALPDVLAAAIMGFMILRMGGELAWGALQELIDTALDEEQVAQIRSTLLATPGVVDVHELRTRRMAHQALVDAHVQVDGRISVSEGHRIAESARARVLREHAEVLDVLVHIDPEDDVVPDAVTMKLPGREAVLRELQPLLAKLPAPRRIDLHYLSGHVEVEIFMGQEFAHDAEGLRRAEAAVIDQLGRSPNFARLVLNCQVAPK